MYKKKDLIKNLEEMNLKATDTVLVHSSMKSIGNVENRADGVLDVLMDYFSEGLLILPTHSWATMDEDNTFFDVNEHPSCVGILTDLFRKRPNVYRSNHPTHSVAAYGKDAKNYIEGEEDVMTPGAVNGCWGRLPEVNAKIMLLGCPHGRNTYIHSIEEIVDVPNRIAKNGINFTIKKQDGEVIERVFHKHHSEGMPQLSDNYDKAKELFELKGIVTKYRFGDAEVLLMDAKVLRDFVLEMLSKDIDVFSTREALKIEDFV